MFSNSIIVYSNRLIADYSLERWKNKIHIAYHHSIDHNVYIKNVNYNERNRVIGYVGRFSEEKGIIQFIQATKEIVKSNDGVQFLVIGDGNLRPSIIRSVQANNLNDIVALPGWISHEHLPDYLNQLKLLVIPSDTEGLPNIMLEAMACGTPVLATPVGAIPDVIIDGKTGFIMEKNTPECIADNVNRALNSSDLDQIAENGRMFVKENFKVEKVIQKWEKFSMFLLRVN